MMIGGVSESTAHIFVDWHCLFDDDYGDVDATDSKADRNNNNNEMDVWQKVFVAEREIEQFSIRMKKNVHLSDQACCKKILRVSLEM